VITRNTKNVKLIVRRRLLVTAGHRAASQTGHVHGRRGGRSGRGDRKPSQFGHHVLGPERALCPRRVQGGGQRLERRTHLVHASHHAGEFLHTRDDIRR